MDSRAAVSMPPTMGAAMRALTESMSPYSGSRAGSAPLGATVSAG